MKSHLDKFDIICLQEVLKEKGDGYERGRKKEQRGKRDESRLLTFIYQMFSLANYRQQLLLEAACEKGFPYYTKSIDPHWLSGKFIDAGNQKTKKREKKIKKRKRKESHIACRTCDTIKVSHSRD